MGFPVCTLMQQITLTRPDDWHLHLRDDASLATTVPDAARQFGRAIVMPNLRPPVTTVEQAAAYRERILAAIPPGIKFEPLMTLYLTDNTPPGEIDRAKASGFVRAVKLYPAGATTNSDAGVTSMDKVSATLARMQEVGLPLLVHGEVTNADVDIFDRERVFIDRVFLPLQKTFPGLRTVFEHITTAEAAQFVSEAGDNVAATITAHHLLLNRNALFVGGMRPHNYCLPVLKRETHRAALVAAAISGNPRFFLGTDSAPHAKSTKEVYAEAFDEAGALDKLEAFASHNGPDWYGLPRNSESITLVREGWRMPLALDYLSGDPLVPLRAGESVAWRRA
jgi:dihydroorotase